VASSVVADAGVPDGRLADVRVSGDFFLEPGDALDCIDAAVTGLPATADTSVIAASIEASHGREVMLAGFSVGAVATAVRRAVTRASGWQDHDWQLVHEGPQDPALHTAINEVLSQEVAAGHRPPTLPVWEWSAPADPAMTE
jgi:lipoate-protein ligase A